MCPISDRSTDPAAYHGGWEGGMRIFILFTLLGGCDGETIHSNDLTVPASIDMAVNPNASGYVNIYSYSATAGAPTSGGEVSAGFVTDIFKSGTSCIPSSFGRCKLTDCTGDLANGITFHNAAPVQSI